MSKHLAMIIEDNQDLAVIFTHALQAAGLKPASPTMERRPWRSWNGGRPGS